MLVSLGAVLSACAGPLAEQAGRGAAHQALGDLAKPSTRAQLGAFLESDEVRHATRLLGAEFAAGVVDGLGTRLDAPTRAALAARLAPFERRALAEMMDELANGPRTQESFGQVVSELSRSAGRGAAGAVEEGMEPTGGTGPFPKIRLLFSRTNVLVLVLIAVAFVALLAAIFKAVRRFRHMDRERDATAIQRTAPSVREEVRRELSLLLRDPELRRSIIESSPREPPDASRH